MELCSIPQQRLPPLHSDKELSSLTSCWGKSELLSKPRTKIENLGQGSALRHVGKRRRCEQDKEGADFPKGVYLA